MTKKIKNLIVAILVVSVIAAMVAIPTLAAYYVGTTVTWNEMQTSVTAVGTGQAEDNESYGLHVQIDKSAGGSVYTTETGCTGRRSISVSTNVTYPSPIPLINAYGYVF